MRETESIETKPTERRFLKRAAARLRLALLLAAFLALGIGLGYLLAPAQRAVPAMSDAASPEEDQLSKFRTDREQLRAMQKSQLNEIIHGGGADGEIIAMAQRQLLSLCRWEETENTLEGVLRLRGYEDCVVTVHDASVNVLVRTELLTRQDSSLILELVCRESGAQSGNVKIIPIN